MHTKYPTAGMRAIQIGGLRPAARVELPKWIWSKNKQIKNFTWAGKIFNVPKYLFLQQQKV